jgi:hypothetical protein
MTEWHESLDECVDRVAKSMTAVDGNPRIGTIIADRLARAEPEQRAALTPQTIAFGIGAAAAAVVAALWLSPLEEPRLHGRPNVQWATVRAPVAPQWSPTLEAQASNFVTPPVRVPAGIAIAAEVAPGPAALAGPASIAPGTLQLDALGLEPVRVAPLVTPELSGDVQPFSHESKE